MDAGIGSDGRGLDGAILCIAGDRVRPDFNEDAESSRFMSTAMSKRGGDGARPIGPSAGRDPDAGADMGTVGSPIVGRSRGASGKRCSKSSIAGNEVMKSSSTAAVAGGADVGRSSCAGNDGPGSTGPDWPGGAGSGLRALTNAVGDDDGAGVPLAGGGGSGAFSSSIDVGRADRVGDGIDPAFSPAPCSAAIRSAIEPDTGRRFACGPDASSGRLDVDGGRDELRRSGCDFSPSDARRMAVQR